VGERVVTPRAGKPVEVNALWIRALRVAADLGARCGDTHGAVFTALAERASGAFIRRFWDEGAGHLRDVVDGPYGDDATLRPNQIIAASLVEVPLSPAQRAAVVQVCAEKLLTPHGLRTLAPDHRDYQPVYTGSPDRRDAAYHQGTAWAWLLGPFVRAHLAVHGDRARARSFLRPLTQHLGESAGLGSVSEVFDAAPPFWPGGCFAQAWSVAELLRAWRDTAPWVEPPRPRACELPSSP
jgi:glycogen debranching enzyme